MLEETFDMKWDIYQSHALNSRREMYEQNLFTDVTLVSDDHVKFSAHKTVLAAASPVLKSLLMLSISEGHQILFLKGVHSGELESLLKYIYLGQASVSLSNIQGFSAASKELGIIENSLMKEAVRTSHDGFHVRSFGENKVEKLDFLSDIKFDDDNESDELTFLETETEPPAEFNTDTPIEDSNTDLLEKFANPDDLTSVKKVTTSENDKVNNYEVETNEEASDKNVDGSVETAKKFMKNQSKKERWREPADCDICNVHFTTKRSYQRHVKVVHELAWLRNCDQCGKVFASSQSLKTHKMTHLEKTIPCPDCHKKFISKAYLRLHTKKMHSKICEFHKVRFSTNEELQQHLKEEHIDKYC